MRRRMLLGVALFGALLLALTAAVPASGAATLKFKTGFLPGSGDGNEPSMAISTTGVRYASWQSPGEFAVSSDGFTWTNTGSPDPGAIGDVTNAVDASGAVYNGQICGLPAILHTCIYRSTDGTQTWPQQTIAADSNPGASDRPWIDVYPHATSGTWNPDNTTVYLEYHTFSPDDMVYVTKSTDGGKTFGPPMNVTNDPNALSSSTCNTVPSGVSVDQNGTVYVLWLSGNDVTANLASGCNYSQLGPFDKAWVSVSSDGGTTWHAYQAWQGKYNPSTQQGDNADKIFGTIGVDQAGQVHVLLPVRAHDDPVGFATDCETNPNCQETPEPTNLLLVSSPDQGQHWTSPFSVTTGTGSNFFPWVAAGGGGRIDGIYYSSSTTRPNDPSSVWYANFAAITGANATLSGGRAVYTTTPRVTYKRLDLNPVHIGGICTFGIFCSVVPNANRNLADSIAIALDPAGGANAVWTNDNVSPEQIEFACQSGGPSATTGQPLSGCYQAT
jgi:hypothetical protein